MVLRGVHRVVAVPRAAPVRAVDAPELDVALGFARGGPGALIVGIHHPFGRGDPVHHALVARRARHVRLADDGAIALGLGRGGLARLGMARRFVAIGVVFLLLDDRRGRVREMVLRGVHRVVAVPRAAPRRVDARIGGRGSRSGVGRARTRRRIQIAHHVLHRAVLVEGVHDVW